MRLAPVLVQARRRGEPVDSAMTLLGAWLVWLRRAHDVPDKAGSPLEDRGPWNLAARSVLEPVVPELAAEPDLIASLEQTARRLAAE